MAIVKWRCPKCRNVFEVTQGQEPLMCGECASVPVKSNAKKAMEAGLPPVQAVAVSTPPWKFQDHVPAVLSRAVFAGAILQALGALTIILSAVLLIVAVANSADVAPYVFPLSISGIIGGFWTIALAGIPAGILFVAKIMADR